MTPDDLKYITDRLPPNHGITDIESEFEAADGNRNETLARLFERLAASSNYQSESIGSTSRSNPLFMERAAYWRNMGTGTQPGGSGGTITNIPVINQAFSGGAFSFGTELG